MYSYEDRIRAVKLYEQYGYHAAVVIRELGYPDRHMLRKLHQEFVSSGDLRQKQSRKPKYTEEQRKAAVDHYLNHGKNMNLERMETAGLTRSMSKKGCSPDNAACEGFHGRLKNEFFYNRDWRSITIDGFIAQLDQYPSSRRIIDPHHGR